MKNAEQVFNELKEAYDAKHPNVSIIRDSWEGGHTVQYILSGCCKATLIRSGDCISYSANYFK